MAPTLTVVIPTRNRKDALRDVLASVYEQNLPVSVIVMDDGSTDATASMLATEFPMAKYDRTETAHGPAYQRNRGVQMAQTEIVVTLDDDCILSQPSTLEATVGQFCHDRIAGVTIPFINANEPDDLKHAAPESTKIHACFDYFAGMVAFRRRPFLETGGYRESFFMHVEEADLSIRLLERGYFIRLGNAAPIRHMESPTRDRARLDFLGPRNHLMFCWYNVPMPYLPAHALGTSLYSLLHGIRKRTLKQVIRGLAQGWCAAGRVWKERCPVRRTTYRISRQLRRNGSDLLNLLEPQIAPEL